MERSAGACPRAAMGLAALLFVLSTGCSRPGAASTLWNPLKLRPPFAPTVQPVRVGVAADAPGLFDVSRWAARLSGAPWNPLDHLLSRVLHRPVQFESLDADQIAFHLESGRLQFALLTRSAFDRVRAAGTECRVIAVSEALHRQGVIVARADSPVRAIQDLKGRRFAFGWRDDLVLDVATVETLESGGVTLQDLSQEWLPIPGARQYHLSSRDAAREIVYGWGTDAGVIDAAEFDAYPPTGGRWTLRGFTFSRDQFRELARTRVITVETIDDGPFVVAAGVDPALREVVRDTLLSLGRAHPDVATAMGLSGFRSAAGRVVPGPDDVLPSPDP